MSDKSQRFYKTRIHRSGGVGPNWGGPVTTDFYTVPIYAERVTTGTTRPDWKNLVANGQPATTPFSGVYEETPVISLDWRWESHRTPQGDYRFVETSGYLSNDVGSLLRDGDTMDPDLYNQIYSQFSSHMRQAATSVQIGVAIGERDKTASMLAETANKVADLVRASMRKLDGLAKMKKRVAKKVFSSRQAKRRALRDFNRAVNDAYLQFQFGWKPLAMDVKGALQALKQDHSREVSYPFQATVFSSSSKPISIKPNNQQYPVYGVFTCTITKKCSIKMKAAIRTAPTSGQNYARSLGADLPAFAPTLYELIPFSFVLDYVWNLGALINGLSTYGINLAWVNRSDKVETSISGSFSPTTYQQPEQPDGSWFVESGSGSISGKRSWVRRSSEIPEFRWPVITTPKSQQNANLASLALSRIMKAQRSSNA